MLKNNNVEMLLGTNNKEEMKMKKMSKRNARKIIYVIGLVLIVVFAEEWFNLIDMLVPKSSMDGAEIFLIAPLWVSRNISAPSIEQIGRAHV